MNHTLRRFSFAALALSMSLLLAGCQARSEAAAGGTAKAASPKPLDSLKPAPEAVELDPAMLANVKIVEARQDRVPRLLTATGKVQFNEDRTARILAPLQGQVIDLRVRVGDRVAKDEVLFSIKSREVSALVTDYLQGQRDQSLAEKTYTMTQDLFEHQAASRMALQQAEGDLAKAKAQVARAEESLRVYGLDPRQITDTTGVRTLVPVRAPLAGTVIERPVTPAQFVQADSTPLITVADLSTVWVMVDIFESDVHLVRPGQRVEVTATAYPDRRFAATVERINDKVDPDTRTLKVRLLVSNPGLLLKPEMFITASLVLSETAPEITVPAQALFTEGDRSYAFVALDDRHFERRQVAAAPDGAAGRRRVLSGILPGDRVIADGALLMRSRQHQQQQPE